MKLKSITLHPFAGIQNKTIEFEDGLNILLGPNEAGKSTVYHAILAGLLTPTSLTAAKVESLMGRFFPATGGGVQGDTIRVDLELLDDNQNIIRIQKTWKKGNRQGSASFQVLGRSGVMDGAGAEITDEDAVQKRIEARLPVTPATLRTILLADQSGLHRTIREMQEEDSVREELGGILRQNLMEMDGVSVDRFRYLLDTRYEEYFKRWDREEMYPENNRGIRNPYQTGKGKVLEAFYQKEQLALDLANTRKFEEGLDERNEALTDLIKQKNEKSEGYERYQPLREGIANRQRLEQEIALATTRQETLHTINREWPVLENTLQNLEPKRENLQQKQSQLEVEKRKADDKAKAARIEERLQKLKQLEEAVTAAELELLGKNRVDRSDVDGLRDLQTEIRRLQTQIEAAQLTLKMVATSDGDVHYAEVGKEGESLQVREGDSLEKIASGGFTLKTKELELQVLSGNGDLEGVIEEHEQRKEEFASKLQELQVDSLQDAVSDAALYEDAQNRYQNAKQQYENELGDDRVSDLQDSLEAMGDLSEVRPINPILEDLVNCRTDLQGLEKEAGEARAQLEAWKEEYGTHNDVVDALSETNIRIRGWKSELEELPALPEEFATSEAFFEYVDALDQGIRALEGQISELRIEKATFERGASDTSSEELERMHSEAVEDFDRVLREANTLANVRERAHELLASMDANTYQGLEGHFLEWLQQMAGDRFNGILMEEDMPKAFQTGDQRELPYEILSHGTKDTVALAWRFALVEYFLKENAGFIILDDPMVDMDSRRREGASHAIRTKAQQKQVIVMTCHPEHSAVLLDNAGGKVIEIGGVRTL